MLFDWFSFILNFREKYVKYVSEILKVTYLCVNHIYRITPIFVEITIFKKPTKMINALFKKAPKTQEALRSPTVGQKGQGEYIWTDPLLDCWHWGWQLSFPAPRSGPGTRKVLKYIPNKFSLLGQFGIFFSINWGSERDNNQFGKAHEGYEVSSPHKTKPQKLIEKKAKWYTQTALLGLNRCSDAQSLDSNPPLTSKRQHPTIQVSIRSSEIICGDGLCIL